MGRMMMWAKRSAIRRLRWQGTRKQRRDADAGCDQKYSTQHGKPNPFTRGEEENGVWIESNASKFETSTCGVLHADPTPFVMLSFGVL